MNRSTGQQTGRRGLWLLLMTGLLLLPAMLPAQGIQVTALTAPVTTLRIGDVDFVNSPAPKWLFTIDINTGGKSIDARLHMSLRTQLASGEDFNPATSLVTKSFRVEGMRTITNLDIGKGKAIEVEEGGYEKNPDAKKKFETVALPSGVMPAGVYTFHV